MPSAVTAERVSCSICSAGLELIKVDHLWLLVATAASIITSLDTGPELMRGNRARLWLLVAAAASIIISLKLDAGLWLLVAAAASMIVFLDAGLVCVPHLISMGAWCLCYLVGIATELS